MSMRPIDLQVIMPKTTEAAKVQQVLKDGNESQQSILSAQFQEQLKTAREKVNERQKPEEIKMESDKNRHKEKDKNKQGNRKKKDNPKNSTHIDIRI